jgi:hypothetical protein
MLHINKSVAQEYVFNKNHTAGGYPMEKLINTANEINIIVGGKNVSENNYVNHKRFENLVLPIGLATFSFGEPEIQHGGYQLSKSSKSNSSTTTASVNEIDSAVYDGFVYQTSPQKYKNYGKTKDKRIENINKSKRIKKLV